jgi:hypothetical protein
VEQAAVLEQRQPLVGQTMSMARIRGPGQTWPGAAASFLGTLAPGVERVARGGAVGLTARIGQPLVKLWAPPTGSWASAESSRRVPEVDVREARGCRSKTASSRRVTISRRYLAGIFAIQRRHSRTLKSRDSSSSGRRAKRLRAAER